jgi:gliding motility-associated-like protein
VDYQISFLDLSPLDSLPGEVDCGAPLPDAPQLFFLDVYGDTLPAEVELAFVADSCGYEVVYTWTATDSTCMVDTSVSRSLMVNPVLPTLFAPDDITLFCDELGALPQTITYSNGLDGPCEISGTVSGELELVVGSPDCPEEYLETWTLDICDTTITASRTVKVNPAPFVLDCPADTTVCGFDEVPPLDTMGIVQAGGCGALSIVVTSTQDTIGPGLAEVVRNVVITDDCGQTATCNQIIEVDLLCDTDPFCKPEYVFIPNTFTPDGNRRNDVLRVRSLLIDRNEVEDFEFMIYSGWGEQLFRTTDPSQGWDGTHQGKMLEHGVYGYYVRLRCPGGRDLILKGNVTLLR